MKIRIKKLTEKAVMPKKAHPTDAGFDLVATSFKCDEYGNYIYGTDLAFEIPDGYVGLIFPRSSICKYDLFLTNAVGVIDSHYRGEVTVKFKSSIRIPSFKTTIKHWLFKNIKDVYVINVAHRYEIGERVGQLIIMPIPEVEFEEAEELSKTDRGDGGYGSSGR